MKWSCRFRARSCARTSLSVLPLPSPLFLSQMLSGSDCVCGLRQGVQRVGGLSRLSGECPLLAPLLGLLLDDLRLGDARHSRGCLPRSLLFDDPQLLLPGGADLRLRLRQLQVPLRLFPRGGLRCVPAQNLRSFFISLSQLQTAASEGVSSSFMSRLHVSVGVCQQIPCSCPKRTWRLETTKFEWQLSSDSVDDDHSSARDDEGQLAAETLQFHHRRLSFPSLFRFLRLLSPVNSDYRGFLSDGRTRIQRTCVQRTRV